MNRKKILDLFLLIVGWSVLGQLLDTAMGISLSGFTAVIHNVFYVLGGVVSYLIYKAKI
ncbi:hypothetical protein HY008_01325 [Candidatus Woesebacteria bacterium]|nr:hypothetical protein [Candidatus Woesebacteria bacterium]